MIKVMPILTAFMLMLVFLGGATYSYAAPVQGVVDPGANWASTLSGTATYTFTNLLGASTAPMVAIDLGFTGGMFNLASTGIIASSVSSGWNLVTMGNGTYELAILGGAPISPGSSLSFAANYSLIGSALTNGGTPWQQYFSVVYAGSPFLSGGVTSVSTPEASSLILLGSALAGLALWRKRQNATPNI